MKNKKTMLTTVNVEISTQNLTSSELNSLKWITVTTYREHCEVKVKTS